MTAKDFLRKKNSESKAPSIENIMEQYAKEAFIAGWTSARKEENKRQIAELSNNDRKFELVQDYYDQFNQQS